MIYLGQTDDFASQYGWVNLDELSEEEFEKERQAYFDELNLDYSYGQEAYEKLMQLDIIALYPGHGPIVEKNGKEHIKMSYSYL